MIGATRGALRRLQLRHGTGAVAALLIVLGVAAGAFAYWTSSGAGSGSASAATLSAPTGVTGAPSGPSVTVSWTGVTPPASVLTGYYVTRFLGAAASNACGTVPGTTATYIAAGVTSCVDTGLASNTYTYRVTAVFRSWSADSALSGNVVVNADPTPPTQALTLTSGAGTSYLSGGTVFYRGDLAGNFTLSDAVTDSGSGPASATFPGLSTGSWNHTNTVATTGTGSAPTITYFGGTYSWVIGAPSLPGPYAITGSDVQGNTVSTNLTFTSDVTGPTGGALVVNGITGTAGGATAYSNNGTITGTRTDYSADTGAGFPAGGSTLRLEVGTLSNGLCSAFTAPAIVTGAPSLTGQAAGCYRYTLTGLDRVGNASVLTTTVQVDLTAPTQVLSEVGANSFLTGTTLYYKSDVGGTLTLSDAVTDNGSGPRSVDFPALSSNNWTHTLETVTPGTGTYPTMTYPSTTYTWLAGATSPPLLARTITARDQALNAGTVALAFTPDAIVPTAGALTLNAATATAGAGSISSSGSGTFTGTRTDWTDLESGIAATNGSVLTRAVAPFAANVCGTYAAATTVTGVPNESGLATGCYKYVLTGTDNVGNTTSVTTVVRVDRGNPVQTLTENGANSFLTGSTLYYRGGTAGSLTLTSAVTDAGVGPKDVQFPAFSAAGWGHTAVETVTGASPYTSSAITWSGAALDPPAYVVTARDNVDNQTTTSLDLVSDSDGPIGGALSANGQAASVTGTFSTSTTGTYTGTYTPYTDGDSGVATETITRETGTLSGNSCSAFAPPVTVAWTTETALPTSCYRYTVTSTDNVGNVSSISTTVMVDRDAPTQTLSETGPNAYLNGSTLFFNNNVSGTFTLTDTVNDPATGAANATFPVITAAGWTHAAETVSTGAPAFVSSAYSWTAGAATPPTHSVVGTDLLGNAVTTGLTLTPDVTGPAGGALSVASTVATANGSYLNSAATNAWAITRTNFSTDAGGSGFASSVLTREFASQASGCTPYLAANKTVIAATTDTAHTAAGCYRYTLTGTDNVGNTSVLSTTIVTFNENTAPTQTFTASGDGYAVGQTIFYRGGAPGAFTITSAVTDTQSGPKQVAFGTVNGTGNWTHNAQTVTAGTGGAPTVSYTSSTYSWSVANPTLPVDANFRAANASDNDNNVNNVTLTFTSDVLGPTGGGLSVNGTAAAAGGALAGQTVTGNVTGTRTDYTVDAGSGVAASNGSVLTRQYAAFTTGTTCPTTFTGTATTITGAPSETGLATGCYRYTLTGKDNLGNLSSVNVTVPVIPGSLTQTVTMTPLTGSPVLNGTTLYYNPAVGGTFTLTDTVTGVGSNPASADYPAMATAGWTKTVQTSTTPGTGTGTKSFTSNTFTWAANPTQPGPYTVSGRNALGNTVDTALTFAPDTTGPTGGSLTVTGVAGTAAGATGYSNGSATWAFTPFNADTESGYATTALTRASTTIAAGGVCGTTYGAAAAVTGTSPSTGLTAGCWKYTLTGTDRVGNKSDLSVIVKVDLTNPSALVLTDDNVNGHLVGTQMFYRASGGTLKLNAALTDAGVGPGSVSFPALTGGFTHAAETPSSVGPAPTATYTSSDFVFDPGATSPGPYTVTGRDLAGNPITSTIATWTSDGLGPVNGALTVNGTAATATGTESDFTYAATPAAATAIQINTRTNYSADAGSGFASSILRVQSTPWDGVTCGTTYGPATVIGASAAQTLPGGYCHKFTLTGTDNVGNESVLTTVVRSTLRVQSVTLANGSFTAGSLNRTDTIAIKYTGPISVASLCPTWSGDFTDQSIATDSTVGVTILEDDTAGVNDQVFVDTAGTCDTGFRFGTLTLGDDGYLDSTNIQVFRGTGANKSLIAYNAATYTLTITLGINLTTPGNDGSNVINGATIATYNPYTILGTVRGVGGIALTGTGATTSVRQF